MEESVQALAGINLFEGIGPRELETVLACLAAERTALQKGEFALTAGGEIRRFGIVESGTLQVLREDADGRQVLLAALGRGDTFAEAFVCAGVKISPVSVFAATQARFVTLDYARLVQICPNACAHHARLVSNMLKILAQKNLAMNRKIAYLSMKGLRQKLAAFLLSQARGAQSDSFELPFSRTGLADYLNADRSAVSRELSRMRADGLIEFERSRFRIKDPAALARAQE